VELRIDESRSHEQSAPVVAPARDAAQSAMTEAEINYLRMMTMTLLNELNSLTQNRREPAGHQIDLKAEVLRFESELIRSALQATHGQQRRAARLLGTNATTLNTKLKRLKIGADEDADTFAVSASGEIGFNDDDGQPLTFAEAMDRYEVSLIQNALIHTGGNQSKAARLLQLPITTLNSKIKKLKIDVSELSTNVTNDLRLLGGYHSLPSHSATVGSR
jgi:DNA-binding NtrC family response regulator